MCFSERIQSLDHTHVFLLILCVLEQILWSSISSACVAYSVRARLQCAGSVLVVCVVCVSASLTVAIPGQLPLEGVRLVLDTLEQRGDWGAWAELEGV